MFGFIIILAIIAISSNHALHKQNLRLQRDLTYFESTYTRKSGYTAFWSGSTNGVNYDLRSFDGGKNWYAVEMDNGKDTLTIKGPAETIYPGLMKNLQDWDNIVAYAEKNGPINPSNPNDLKVLTNNGFSVTRKTN